MKNKQKPVKVRTRNEPIANMPAWKERLIRCRLVRGENAYYQPSQRPCKGRKSDPAGADETCDAQRHSQNVSGRPLHPTRVDHFCLDRPVRRSTSLDGFGDIDFDDGDFLNF